jgi:hypothetical protein
MFEIIFRRNFIMAEWHAKIKVTNRLNQALKVEARIPYGVKKTNFPEKIAPNDSFLFDVYSPSGKSWGPEYYLTLTAIGSPSYGTVKTGIDIPYWKHENSSYCTADGIIDVAGYKAVTDGAHNWENSLTLTETLDPIKLAEGYNSRYQWSKISQLPLIKDTDDYNSLIPDKDLMNGTILLRRTEPQLISSEQWPALVDPRVKTNNKSPYIQNYFMVCCYTIHRIKNINLPEGKSLREKITITHSSQTRKETKEEMSLKSTVGAEASGIKAEISASYGVTNIDEYIEKDEKTTEVEMNYEARTFDRDIVIWDFTKDILIYRTDFRGNVSLVGVSDFYKTTKQKTYKLNSDLLIPNFQ